jgi:protocatechuate 3,4-dioxygenase beta subunit
MMPDALSKFGRISDHQLSFFFIVWLFLPVNSLSQAVAPSRGKLSAAGFRIAGTVVNSVTGASLTQARVALVDTKNPANVFQVFTSENGHFDFSNLSAGKYSLQGAKSGYLPAAYDQHEQFSTAIVTGPDFRTDQLILRLTPMAIIAGHVIDEAGEPVRKAIVTLFREDHRAGITRINRRGTSTTDDLGFYDFSLLGPGTYFISVTAKPWYAVHPPSNPDAPAHSAQLSNPLLDVAYPTTYYSGATEAESATPITVAGGDRVQVDIHLNPVPALHLVVRVQAYQAEQPNRISMPMLQKHVFDAVERVQTEGMQLIAPGVYEISGVPAGRYTVRIEGASPGQAQQASNVDLTHDGQDLTSRTEPLANLKLTAKMPGDEKLPKQFVFVLQDAHSRVIAARGVDDVSGEAKFEGVPAGKYAIMAFSPAQPFSVVQTTSPGGVLQGHDLNVVSGANLDVTVALAAGVVSVEGTVQKGGKPLAGVMVALVPDNPIAHVELFRRDQSDFDGTFAVRGVIPGNYTIVAVEDAWGFEWLQPGVLARYVQHGQKLTIGKLMHGEVHLPDPVEVQPR